MLRKTGAAAARRRPGCAAGAAFDAIPWHFFPEMSFNKLSTEFLQASDRKFDIGRRIESNIK
jgi:hypothetical protein